MNDRIPVALLDDLLVQDWVKHGVHFVLHVLNDQAKTLALDVPVANVTWRLTLVGSSASQVN